MVLHRSYKKYHSLTCDTLEVRGTVTARVRPTAPRSGYQKAVQTVADPEDAASVCLFIKHSDDK